MVAGLLIALIEGSSQFTWMSIWATSSLTPSSPSTSFTIKMWTTRSHQMDPSSFMLVCCFLQSSIRKTGLNFRHSNSPRFADEIESLPLTNTAEVFGLHPNAEIGYYTQAARDIWTHLIELQPQTGTWFILLYNTEI